MRLPFLTRALVKATSKNVLQRREEKILENQAADLSPNQAKHTRDA